MTLSMANSNGASHAHRLDEMLRNKQLQQWTKRNKIWNHHWNKFTKARRTIIMVIKSFCLVIWREIAAYKNQFDIFFLFSLFSLWLRIRSEKIVEVHITRYGVYVKNNISNSRQFNLRNRVSTAIYATDTPFK